MDDAPPPMVGIVIYARVEGGFSVWDPARAHQRRRDAQSIADADREAALHFDRKSLWDGLQVGDRRFCEGLIRDWVGWQRSKAHEFGLLREVLKELSGHIEELRPGKPVRVHVDDGFDTPTIVTPYGLFRQGEISEAFLKSQSPFVWFEAKRQKRLK
jgi:hypothetical protein